MRSKVKGLAGWKDDILMDFMAFSWTTPSCAFSIDTQPRRLNIDYMTGAEVPATGAKLTPGKAGTQVALARRKERRE